MKQEKRYTQSDFNRLYTNALYWKNFTNDYNYDQYFYNQCYDQICVMLKTEKYLDGPACPELIYIQNIDEKSGYTWQNASLPEPNIILQDDLGTSTYIYVCMSSNLNIEDYAPILTTDIRSNALFMCVKCDYPEEQYYFDHFSDKVFSYFRKSLNGGKYSKKLENPNNPYWKPIFKNVPVYRVKDLINFAL